MPVQFDKIVENKTTENFIDELSGYKTVYSVLTKTKLSTVRVGHSSLDSMDLLNAIFYQMMDYVFDMFVYTDYVPIGIEYDENSRDTYYHFCVDDATYCIKMYASYDTYKKLATIVFEPVTKMSRDASFNLEKTSPFRQIRDEFTRRKMQLEIKFTFNKMTKIL